VKFSDLKGGKDYLEAIRFAIPLNGIKDYDKHLMCKDEESKFCHVHRYQLQTWKNCGFIIFEREIRPTPN
jgi:hypothetical protein